MSGQGPNRGSFQRGISGNPGGKPATAEVSALARRYTADWVRGLVDIARLPRTSKNAASIVSASIALRDTGYPGLTKGPSDAGSPTLHLHYLAVTNMPRAGAQEPLHGAEWIEGHLEAEAEPPLDERLMPRPDQVMPHEALPLWDASHQTGEDET